MACRGNFGSVRIHGAVTTLMLLASLVNAKGTSLKCFIKVPAYNFDDNGLKIQGCGSPLLISFQVLIMTLSKVLPINAVLSVLIFTALSVGSSNSYASEQSHHRSDKHYDKHSDKHKSHKQRKRRTQHVHNDNCDHRAQNHSRHIPRLIGSIGNIVQFSLGGPKPHYHHVHGRRVQCYDRHGDNHHSGQHSGYGSYDRNSGYDRHSEYDRHSNYDRHSGYDRHSNYDRRSRERVNYDHHHKPYGCAHRSHRARNDHRYSDKHRYEDKYAHRGNHIRKALKHLIKAHYHGARECYTRH